MQELQQSLSKMTESAAKIWTDWRYSCCDIFDSECAAPYKCHSLI